MVNVFQRLAAGYRWYLARPWLVLFFFVGFCAIAGFQAQNFYYEASSETLVAENDPDLLYFRQVSEHFGDAPFMFMTYTPRQGDLLSQENIDKLKKLVERVRIVDGVATVTSILDVPLLKSPPMPLSEMATGYKTLESEDVDFEAAQKELASSPLFKELLISKDGRTTALRIVLNPDQGLDALWERRNVLRIIKHPTAQQKQELEQVNEAYRQAYSRHTNHTEKVLDELRNIRLSQLGDAQVYLGGVPMIASDMMQYVRSDILIFGLSSVVLMMLMLYVFFNRALRWVFLPMMTTGIVLLTTIGTLGFLQKPITVISSNFISLLIILSISIAVHLITRYRGFIREYGKKLSHEEIIYKTMLAKIAPCVYTTLTTMAGFASLSTSSIVPVTDFGLLMCMGVSISLVMFYLFFPVVLMLFPKEKMPADCKPNQTRLVRMAYRIAVQHTSKVLWGSALLIVVTLLGMARLSLNNNFIGYFRESTEVHQGLSFIDANMGGTVPMDIIVNFPPFQPANADSAAEDDFFDVAEDPDPFPERYWFTPDKIEVLHRIESYLNERPEIGKVISMATLETLAREFNDGQPLDALTMVATLGMIPDQVRDEFIAPFAKPEAGLMRISTRIHETGPSFSREELIQDIKEFAATDPELKNVTVHVTGLNVLFNGMLKELFHSQTTTLFFVIAATLGMFWILLRSPLLAVLGVLPNVFSAFMILGFMGWVGMPLDMMTITIAAIVIGIGVDDAIHYLHFFRERYQASQNVQKAVEESHSEIGRALYVTSLTVIIGFSVLCASNFVPTVYFGILSAAAMFLALGANLVLLPALLLIFYGRWHKPARQKGFNE